MAKGSRARLSTLAAAFCYALVSVSGPATAAGSEPLLTEAKSVQVKSKPFDRFRIGRNVRTFGPLTFLGGLELISADRNVGGLSGLLSLDHGNGILAVTDNGLWFAADIEQDEHGTPLSISNPRYTPLLGTEGETLRTSWRHDTEAVTIDGDSLLVSAEQVNSIFRYPWPLATGKERMIEELAVSPEIKALRGSKGMEAMAMSPPGTPLAGTLVIIAERGPSGSDFLPGFLLKDGQQARFKVMRSDRYDATDIAFLPSGDLLLLERRFNLRDLVGMRLRRFEAGSLTPGAELKGEVLMDADYGYQIDNMEALDIHTGPDGQPILTLLSDNNRSLLQRTLLLRFALSPQ